MGGNRGSAAFPYTGIPVDQTEPKPISHNNLPFPVHPRHCHLFHNQPNSETQMTVGQLRRILRGLDSSTPVVLTRSEESQELVEVHAVAEGLLTPSGHLIALRLHASTQVSQCNLLEAGWRPIE